MNCFPLALRRGSGAFPKPVVNFALFSLVLIAAFARPLFDLASYSLKDDLYSHTLLVPGVSLYLVWLTRKRLPTTFKAAFGAALVPFLIGAVAVGAYWLTIHRISGLAQTDYLSLTIFSFVCFLWGGLLCFFGLDAVRMAAFPIGFLIWLVPFPTSFITGFETFLQHTSADAAAALFGLSGATVFREGLVFHLPGIAIEVARECSGIHSSLVLLITSLVAGHLFLRSPWRKTALALAVIPLGIARNGFRIFTLGTLCVHVSPKIIDSPLHHRGGPIFFALSLVPFLAFLVLLRRWEKPGKTPMRAPAALPPKNV